MDGGTMPRRRQNTMTDCLRPLLTSMRLFGLYFVRPSSGDGRKTWRCRAAWMFHAVFVVSLLWLNAVRFFSIFRSDDEFDVILINKIVGVLWSLQCAVSQTAFYAACHLGTLQKAFAKMKLSDACARYLRRMVAVYTVAACSVFLVGSTFWLYAIFFTDGFMDMMLAPFVTHLAISDVLVGRIFLMLVSVYLLAAHSFPQAMTYLLATLFAYQFKIVRDDLDRSLEESEVGNIGDADIEAIRQRHQVPNRLFVGLPGADLRFYKGGSPIHLKGAPEVERQRVMTSVEGQ